MGEIQPVTPLKTSFLMGITGLSLIIYILYVITRLYAAYQYKQRLLTENEHLKENITIVDDQTARLIEEAKNVQSHINHERTQTAVLTRELRFGLLDSEPNKSLHGNIHALFQTKVDLTKKPSAFGMVTASVVDTTDASSLDDLVAQNALNLASLKEEQCVLQRLLDQYTQTQSVKLSAN